MRFKKAIPYIIATIIGILLINLLASHYMQMEKATQMFDLETIMQTYFLGTLYCFLIGVLLKWRAVAMLIMKKVKLRLNLLLVPGVLLLLVSFLNPGYYVTLGVYMPFPEGGVGMNMLLGPLQLTMRIQNILSVIAGTIIVRGFYKPEASDI